MNLKKISTGRLLSAYRGLRKSIYQGYYYYDEDIAEMEMRLEMMKAELALREHIPRRRENRRKEKKVLIYRRK